jgi:hypothetical protein
MARFGQIVKMKPLINVSLRYGVLAGVIGSTLLLGLYYMDRHPFLIPVFIDFRIFLFGVFIFFTLREIRDYHQQGILYFWQGLSGSFLFTIAYAIISALLLVLFMAAVPEFLETYVSLSIEQLEKMPADVVERIGQEAYALNLKLLPETSIWDLAFLYIVQSFLISLFVSIILSVILRRQPKT